MDIQGFHLQIWFDPGLNSFKNTSHLLQPRHKDNKKKTNAYLSALMLAMHWQMHLHKVFISMALLSERYSICVEIKNDLQIICIKCNMESFYATSVL